MRAATRGAAYGWHHDGYRAVLHPREKPGSSMSNDLSVGLLTVVGVLGGLASLLVLLSALDPTNVVRTPPRTDTLK